MKILFIEYHYLSGNGGGSFASRAYINAFAEVADEMTLLYSVKEGQNLFSEINKKIELVPVPNNKPKWKKLFDVLTGKVHRYREIARQYILENKYDVVVFDTCLASFGLIDFAKSSGCKTIVIHHNYQYEYFKDNAKGLLRYNTLFWCKRYEKEAVQKADLGLTLTRQDIDLLADNYNNGKKDNLVLLGTFEYCSKSKRSFEESSPSQQRFVITGSLEAVQTEQSLIPWLKDYYPILKEVFPNSTLTIAGKNPGKEIQNLCAERCINLIQSPVSMDPIMENADYYICPTSLGGGLKLRVMDGLKWGLPVITHAVSARGYDLFLEKECMFSYFDIESFESSLEKLKCKLFNRQEVYDSYQSIFSFEAGVNRTKKILEILHKR